ncbi:sensor histidine kinase [Neptunicella marina]|uniref:histidine kinase n=1 Tax=Neptunicella marina TaxID=2125989 RepID=A0A8J6IPW9_9ALTE|nr:ATP-binding protein [Neptunicella marina]MBC3765640.1 histidine kinase [Neptunicella marina]
MVCKGFGLSLAVRLMALLVSLVILSLLITSPEYRATSLVLLGLIILQIIEVIRFTFKTNQELERFLQALKHADFNQRFDLTELGSGFTELGQTFHDVIERFRQHRVGQQQQLKYANALIEQVPVPLLSIHQDKSIRLCNLAARHFFAQHGVKSITDLAEFGELQQTFSELKAGDRKLIETEIDGVQYRLSITASEFIADNKPQMLVSLQDIQSELEGAQLNAWQELVRVLTHEIMNSITPVASLADTAVALVDDCHQQLLEANIPVTQLQDAKDALMTVHRRSQNLMDFVANYRSLTHLPAPVMKSCQLSGLFQQVTVLATSQWQNQGINLHVEVEPPELSIAADHNLLEQMLINLLKNAEQALIDVKGASVWLKAYVNVRGRCIIEVADNGPGIAPQIADKVFVPFYTTKKDGSGVGLALTRQIMLAHGGHVKLATSSAGGALFSLIF